MLSDVRVVATSVVVVVVVGVVVVGVVGDVTEHTHTRVKVVHRVSDTTISTLTSNNLIRWKYVPWNVFLPNACCFHPHYPNKSLPCATTSIDVIIVSDTILKYLTCNFNDLELELLKVIEGQRH